MTTIDYSKLNKRYYSIGETAKMFKVKSSVLRFWEESFSQLNPKKSGGGIRLYTLDDVKLIERIYNLVRDEGYTLEGAQKLLRLQPKESKSLDKKQSAEIENRLTKVQKKLKLLKKRIEYNLNSN